MPHLMRAVVEGAGAGSYCQDTPMNPSMGGSVLGFLPRTVLPVATHPSFC